MTGRGKTFGALKATTLRIICRGGCYAPARALVGIFKPDRDRLRRFCSERGVTMVDGIGRLLDEAGVPRVQTQGRDGELLSLIASLRIRSGETDNKRLADRVRAGEFDDYIAAYGDGK